MILPGYFRAVDANGKVHFVTGEADPVQPPLSSEAEGRAPAGEPAPVSFKTHRGEHVKRVSKGVYELAARGLRLTSLDPDAL